MKLKDILAKLIAGEKIDDKEKEELKKVDPDTLQTELDAEKARAKKLEEDLAAAKAKEKEAEDKVKTAEAEKLKSLPEVEQLRAQVAEANKAVAALTGERDNTKSELATIRKKARIREIADKNGFENAEYLEFLAESGKVDINDDKKIEPWMEGLKKDAPKHFKAAIAPGAGSGQPPVNGKNIQQEPAQNQSKPVGTIDKVMQSLSNAPVIK